MFQSVKGIAEWCYAYRKTLIGLGLCVTMSSRMNTNIKELERNTAEKKLFDPVKARAQMEIYKEIYRLEENENLTEEQKKDIRNKDGALRILQTASDNDVTKINQFFEKKDGADQSEIEQEMERLKLEIDSLSEVQTEHQGYKFYRAAMTKDIFEDALIELREKQFEKKFTAQKEKMTGNEPKIV